MCKTYGYVRISTAKQNMERQVKNILALFPDADIKSEVYTGTKVTTRPVFNKLLKNVKTGDTIVFDEVSRMSRNAAEGVEQYKTLFERGINLVFLKERYIDTAVYRDKMQIQMDKIQATGSKATDKLLSSIMDALHEYTLDLAREQIELAFQSAQNEVDYLHKRTSEGVQNAIDRYQAETEQGLEHLKGMPGRTKGAKVETSKARTAKAVILKHSKDFGGTLSDPEVIKLASCSRNSYYKYKSQLMHDNT